MPDPRLDDLRQILPPGALRIDAESRTLYGRDWTRFHAPDPLAVAFPSTTDQVRALVHWARRTKTPLVPSGGRTGLSAGAVAARGEVVVSAGRLNRILDVNPADQTIRCEAGVTIKSVQDEAARHGLLYPVDFAPSATMQVGGNVATNAGGIRVVRYGPTRNWVAALRVVTGAGDLLDLGGEALKDNAGYDLKHLFVGSEGTLGFITEATLRLTRRPAATALVFAAVASPQNLVRVYEHASRHAPLLACEFFDQAGLGLVLTTLSTPPRLPGRAPYYVLCELEQQPRDAQRLLDDLAKTPLVTDGFIASNKLEYDAIWSIRLGLGAAVAPFTPYKNDVAVPTSELPAFLDAARSLLLSNRPDLRLVLWGHLGDGNVHVNALKPDGLPVGAFADACKAIDPLLYALVRHHRGSISAEHGVGLTKKSSLHFTRSAEEIELMRHIKRLFDPDAIMNPGKIFDA